MSTADTTRAPKGVTRRAEIIRLLQIDGFQSVVHLADRLGVSDMTVRRDLNRLGEAGELRVVHGGASLMHGTFRTTDFITRGEEEHAAKRQIAHKAAGLIGAGATIAIDGGTTTFELTAAIQSSFRGCVISNSMPVLQHMLNLPDARVIGLGGELLTDSQAFVGNLGIEALSQLHAETAFVGAAAISTAGLFVATSLERPTKQALMKSAKTVVLLADHSKFDASAPVHLGPLEDVDILVTDRPLEPDLAESFEAADVTVLIASEDSLADDDASTD